MEIEYLVFEGGGVKGTAYVGAVNVLGKCGVLQNIKGVAGSSVGSIVAMLIACGYDHNEIADALCDLDYTELVDEKGCCTCGWFRWLSILFDGFGQYRGDKLYDFIGSFIKNKLGSKRITFAQLYKRTGIELVVTGTNLDKKKTVYFNKCNYPNMQVRLAVRISSSIPFFYDAVRFEGDTYVDGGMLNNYPINIFDNDGDGVLADNILGCKLLSSDEAPTAELYVGEKEVDNILGFGKCIINSLLYEVERLQQRLNDEDYKQTVVIDTADISTTDFELSLADRNYLIKAGEESMSVYLSKKIDSLNSAG